MKLPLAPQCGRSSMAENCSNSSGTAGGQACSSSTQQHVRAGGSCCVVDWFLACFLLFSTRSVNTKYCINSEKVLDLTAFEPSERDIVHIRSDSMHHNSGYRGRGGGGGHYNGHRPHNSELSLRDFYLLVLSDYVAYFPVSPTIWSHIATSKCVLSLFRLQLGAQREGAPQAARPQR